MSLDFYVCEVRDTTVFDRNITHNLSRMARECCVYTALWHPEELPEGTTAKDLIPILEQGLAELKAKPDHFKQFDASNGWGTYAHFVPFVEDCLAACRENPDAKPYASV
jgi:hypothetical protein